MIECKHEWSQVLGVMGEDSVHYCLGCDSYWSEDSKEWDFADQFPKLDFTMRKP